MPIFARFFGSVSYVLSLSGDGFRKAKPTVASVHICIVPFGLYPDLVCLKTSSAFLPKRKGDRECFLGLKNKAGFLRLLERKMTSKM